MDINLGIFREYWKKQLFFKFEKVFQDKFGTDWKSGWVDLEENEDYFNSPATYAVSENVYNLNTEEDVRNYINNKYVSVIDLQVEYRNTYYYCYFKIDSNSPYYIAGNIFEGEIIAANISSAYNKANKLENLKLLALRYDRTLPGSSISGNNVYVGTFKKLPTHPSFDFKYWLRVPRIWTTDKTELVDEGTEYVIINDDEHLEEWLDTNLPTQDMVKTLESIADLLAARFYDTVNTDNYSLMPIYLRNGKIDSSKIVAMIKDYDDTSDTTLPLIHGEFKSLITAVDKLKLKDEPFMDKYWSSAWHKENITVYYGRDRVLRNLDNAFMAYKGIYSSDNDPFDFFTPEQRANIYPYAPPYKYLRLLHGYNSRFGTNVENDPGNTHEVVRYPVNSVKITKISAVSDESTITYTHVRPLDFKITDTSKPSSFFDLGKKGELVTDGMTTTYTTGKKWEETLYLYIDGHIFYEIKLKEATSVVYGPLIRPYETVDNVNTELPVGEPVMLFRSLEEYDKNIKIKYIDLEDNIESSVNNLALLYEDAVLPIIEVNNKRITVIDNDNIIDSQASQGLKVEISTYWTASVPGELIENRWIGKKINLTKINQFPFYDGIEISKQAVGWNELAAEDIAAVVQSTIHDYMLRVIGNIGITIDRASFISEFDRDWAVAEGTLDISIPSFI